MNLCCFSGYDKAEVDRLLAEGKLTRESKSVSQSVSSLDRDDEDTATLRQARDIMTVKCRVNKMFLISLRATLFAVILRSLKNSSFFFYLGPRS